MANKRKRALVSPGHHRYGHHRVWFVPMPPAVGTASQDYPMARRMQKRGPRLESLPEVPARVHAVGSRIAQELQYWDASEAGSNWDLEDAAILLSVRHGIPSRRNHSSKAEFAPEHDYLSGHQTRRVGLIYRIAALVTRGDTGPHKNARRALAAAMRDAATVIEGGVTTPPVLGTVAGIRNRMRKRR
jgi:hypothetical protein